MKAEEYIQQQIKAGYKIHFHDGVWWQLYVPWFYRPVVALQKLKPGSARPNRLVSFLGYSHLVDDLEIANKHWPVMMLKEEFLECFSLSALSSSKRARVRKGLRLNEVRRITDIDSVISDMQRICISAAKRTGHGRPPESYINNAEEWEEFMRKEFSISGREWWGAFEDNVLVAYYYAYLVDETMFISAAKSHSDHLQNCPNDALLFSFLEFCGELEDCGRVIFGDWSDVPSLNEFKERYGFQRVDLPMHTTLNKIVKWTRRIIR